VSVIPAAALLARPLDAQLPVALAVGAGTVLLAAGLVGLALLPSSDLPYVLASLALCGFGLGLAVPGLTHTVLAGDGGIGRKATLTVGVRHLGLVLALAVVAPFLASDLTGAADVAKLNATAVIIDGELPATTKVPLALDIRDVLNRAPRGEIPDLTAPFEERGASTDPDVRLVRDDLLTAIEQRFAETAPHRQLRLHGDCHAGNVLWTDAGPHFVDLDDCMTGPAVQDLWMLLSGSTDEMSQQLGDVLEGYGQFADFDSRELRLLEPLRTLRMMNYAAWLARRWDDPAFPRAFPWFEEPRYWERHVLDLREQLGAITEPPLEIG